MSPLKTNPAYAALAYRRTIVKELITLLRRDFVGLDTDPGKRMICEEVMSADSEVPVEEIADYVDELEQVHHELTLELRKFEFTKKNNDLKFQPTQKKRR